MQVTALERGLTTGQGLEILHDDMQRTRVSWLELHAPGGIQVSALRLLHVSIAP